MKIPYNRPYSVCIYIISKQYTSIFHHCRCKQAKEMYINKTLLENKYACSLSAHLHLISKTDFWSMFKADKE
jgi:hypothetical protein